MLSEHNLLIPMEMFNFPCARSSLSRIQLFLRLAEFHHGFNCRVVLAPGINPFAPNNSQFSCSNSLSHSRFTKQTSTSKGRSSAVKELPVLVEQPSVQFIDEV